MELIFLVGAMGVVGLYLFNATLCYLVVGGGYLALLVSLLISRILTARRLKVRAASLSPLKPALRIGPGAVAGGGR